MCVIETTWWCVCGVEGMFWYERNIFGRQNAMLALCPAVNNVGYWMPHIAGGCMPHYLSFRGHSSLARRAPNSKLTRTPFNRIWTWLGPRINIKTLPHRLCAVFCLYKLILDFLWCDRPFLQPSLVPCCETALGTWMETFARFFPASNIMENRDHHH